jgi:phosphohistidine phosphatase
MGFIPIAKRSYKEVGSLLKWDIFKGAVMKKLYLIRHAKSNWKDMTLDDFDRPLNKRGRKDAPFMAQKLKEKDIYPDYLISSPAIRAKSTAKTFKEIFQFKKKISYIDSIYHAEVHEIEDIIKNLDNRYDTVFLFAHNPTLNEFIEEHLNIYENIPTCGVVGIGFDCKHWKDVLKSSKEMLLFDYPKNYKTSDNEI